MTRLAPYGPPTGSGPEASAIASEAFSRSWHFIERDPVLAGRDQLALQIQQIMVTDDSVRDPLRIAIGWERG